MRREIPLRVRTPGLWPLPPRTRLGAGQRQLPAGQTPEPDQLNFFSRDTKPVAGKLRADMGAPRGRQGPRPPTATVFLPYGHRLSAGRGRWAPASQRGPRQQEGHTSSRNPDSGREVCPQCPQGTRARPRLGPEPSRLPRRPPAAPGSRRASRIPSARQLHSRTLVPNELQREKKKATYRTKKRCVKCDQQALRVLQGVGAALQGPVLARGFRGARRRKQP